MTAINIFLLFLYVTCLVYSFLKCKPWPIAVVGWFCAINALLALMGHQP